MSHSKKPSSIRSPAAIICGNDDLLIEIFLFLPAISLVRFKLVSKHWHSLISSPNFSRRHILHHRSRRHRRLQHESHHLFILHTITSQYFICNPTTKKLIPFHFPFSMVKILQSCNGLFLLECKNTPYGPQYYYVFNPTTMKHRNLFLYHSCSGLCLMFDPSKSHHYKVFCFRNHDHFTSVLVYDSKTHSWKDGGKFDKGPYKFCDGIYWNDGLYFVRINRSNSTCFSLKDGIRRILSPPKINPQGTKRSYIMESNCHMHYVVLSLLPSKNRVCVYEMIDDDSDWFEKYDYRADFNSISATNSANNAIAIELLGMIRGKKEKDSFLLFHVPGKIMIYRFFDKVFEVLVDFRREYYFEGDRLQFKFKDARRFIESLAPV